VITVEPTSSVYRSSSGFVTSATHAAVVLPVEDDPVIETGDLPVDDLGLRDRGLEVDIPHRRGVGRVREPAREQPQEPSLRGPARHLADRGVRARPIDREPQQPEQRFEGLLVLGGQALAELDEVRTAHRHRSLARPVERVDVERRVARQRRIASHAEVVLHPALRRETVVVPPHRIEDLVAAHPVEPSHQVGVGVALHRPEVQRAARRGRRGVDRVDLVAGLRAVEPVRAVGLPPLAPGGLQAIERGLVGHLHRR
jgi:hypothetical protein